MERAQQQFHDHQEEAAQPGDAVALEHDQRAVFRGGAAPDVEVAPQREQPQSASDQAFAAEGNAAKAAADTQKVLQYIRQQAKQRAQAPMNIGKDSMIYKRLAEHYLPDYLANPNPTTGKAAVERIGEQIDPATADKSDYWESSSSEWNAHEAPASVQLLLPDAPLKMGAATKALSLANRAHMPYIDAPQMVGNPNTETGENADVYGGGKNVSQLMHWATGVKHADNNPQAMRDLFLAYEMYHLEGWDKFAQDPINDLISEDAGRIMGRQLLAGEINQENLGPKLDEGFNEARAWVGTLIKARQGELDAVITSQTVVESDMWYGAIPEMVRWWGDSTIYLDLLDGMSVEEIQADARTQHFIEIYSLVYYADVWQKQNQKKIEHSYFTQAMLAGKYNKVFAKLVKGQELLSNEKLKAYFDAKGPGAGPSSGGRTRQNQAGGAGSGE